MQHRTADIVHVHTVDYVVPRGRTIREARVLATTPVSIAVASASDLSLVARTQRPTSHVGTHCLAEDFVMAGGPLLLPVLDQGGMACGMEALRNAGTAVHEEPWSTRGSPFVTDRCRDGGIRPEDLVAGRIVASGYEAARSRVEAVAADSLLVDGVLHVPVEEPVWTVAMGLNRQDEPPIVRVVPGIPSTAAICIHPTFRADDLAGAMDFAEWMLARHRQQVGGEAEIRTVGAIDVVDPVGLTHDAVLHTFRTLLREAICPVQGLDFSQLPIEALRHWASFREAHAKLEAGFTVADLDCLEALVALADALPVMMPADRNDTAAAIIHRRLAILDHFGPRWLADMRARAFPPLSPEDEAALELA